MDIVVLLTSNKFYNDYPPEYKKIIKHKIDDITVDRILSLTDNDFYLIDESFDYVNFDFQYHENTCYWGNGNCRYIKKSDKFIIKYPSAIIGDKIKDAKYAGESLWRDVDSLVSHTCEPTLIYLNRTGKPSNWFTELKWNNNNKIEILHSTGSHDEIFQAIQNIKTEYAYILTQPFDNIPTYAPANYHNKYVCNFNGILSLRIVSKKLKDLTLDQLKWENGEVNSHTIEYSSVSIKSPLISEIELDNYSDMYYYKPNVTSLLPSFKLDRYIPFSEMLSTRTWARISTSGKKIDNDGEWGLYLLNSFCKSVIKETDDNSVTNCPFDVIFLSYKEKNADIKYNKLLESYPTAKRVHGVDGIFNAHLAAAKLANTDMFFVVDADADILPSFDFRKESEISMSKMNAVHVWKSINKVNGLIYGYGGVKLFPRKKLLEATKWNLDFTTSVSNNFILHDSVANITEFNVTEFDTWKAAFRECVKLTVFSVRNADQDAAHRLNIWLTKCDRSVRYADYALFGAKDGHEYAKTNIDKEHYINMINDFSWLKDRFDEKYTNR